MKAILSFPFSNAQYLHGEALSVCRHGGGRPWTERAPPLVFPKSAEQIV